MHKYPEITQITQKSRKNHAKITQKLRKINKNLPKIMHIVHHEINNVNRAKITQKLCKLRIMKIITKKLRKNYATCVSRGGKVRRKVFTKRTDQQSETSKLHLALGVFTVL